MLQLVYKKIMKIDIFQYKPFEHNNLPIKQNVLQLARNQNKTTVEGVLTSSLVYINTVDYIASHLLDNLDKITYLVAYNEMNSVVFMNPDSRDKGQPLGRIIIYLKVYEFPGKQDFIEELTSFNRIRIKVVHNLLSLTPDELQKIDASLADLAGIAERIIQKYDTIVRGITNAWNSYVYTVSVRMSANTPSPSPSVSPSASSSSSSSPSPSPSPEPPETEPSPNTTPSPMVKRKTKIQRKRTKLRKKKI